MPEAIGAFLVEAGVAIGGDLGAAIIMNAAEIATFTAQVGTFAAVSSYSSAQRRKAARRARDAYNASLQDRTQTIRGTLVPRQMVLGKARTGGALAFVGSTGANKEKLTLVVALCEGPVTGIDTIYFNDQALTLDVDGYVQTAPYYQAKNTDGTATMTLSSGAGSVTVANTPMAGTATVTLDLGGDQGTVSTAGTIAGSTISVSGWGTYSGTARVTYQYGTGTSHARVRSMLGSSTQTVFPDLVTLFPADWTANHRLRGVAYLVVELDYNADAFPSGIPNISAVVRGASDVVDVRTGSTGYTENPALLLRHYLLHAMGGRRTTAQLDDASFIAAANVCDTSVNYGAGATALYTAGLVVSTESPPADVVDDIVEAMAGRWGHSNGKIRVRAGSLASTSAAIDANWLTDSGVSIQPRPSRQDLANTAQGAFVDGEHDWQVVQFPRVTDSTAVTEDGGELVRDTEFAAITRAGQAQQVAAVMLRDARQALTVQMVCNLRAYPLQILDVVTVTLDRFGWSSKLFEVVERSYAHGGGIALTLKETGSSIFAFGSSFATLDPEPNTLLPSPWTVPTVGTITPTSGTATLSDGSVVSRCSLSWAAVADAGVSQGGYIEVAYRDVAGDNTERIVRADTLTGHVLYGLRVGYHYIFKARAVNGAGVRGAWSAPVAHKVDGPRGATIWRQSGTPSNPVEGDLWIDTGNGNRQKWYDGAAWQDVRDTGIAAALTAASDAQATADGKIATFWQTTTPVGASAGDIWFDTDDGYKQYRFDGSAWQVAADTRIGQAISDAATAQATADGKVTTFISASAPTAEGVGDLWLESDNGNKLYRWSGGAWVAIPVGTGAIDANAATDVVTSSLTTDVWTVTGTPPRRTLLGTNWTNGTSASVIVEVTAYLSRRLNAAAGSGSLGVYDWLAWGFNGGSVIYGAQGFVTIDGVTAGTSKEYGTVVSTTVTVAAGDTLNIYALADITGVVGSGSTLETKNSNLRVVAIKR